MPLQTLVQLEDLKTQEMVIIPSLEDFSTLSAEDLSSKGDVLILKNKLLMREGEHNGVFYSWEELKNSLDSGEKAGLYYDHADSAGNWVGDIRNLRGDDDQKAIFGDLHIVDLMAAKKLRYGAKWGVSLSIEAEKLVRDGKTHAIDSKIISCSLVLRPAVRETMLNEQIVERRLKCMEKEEEKKREIEELAKKELAKKEQAKLSAEEKEKLAEENKGLKERVEKYETEELERKSKEVLNHGVGFGILVDEDLTELQELSDKGRAFVSKVIDRVSETLKLEKEDSKEDLKEDYLKFKSEFEKKNLKATEADVKAAFAKLGHGDPGIKKKENPYPNSKLAEDQNKLKENLAEKQAVEDKVNSNFLEFMQEQH